MSLKLLALQIDNFKKIKCFYYQPKGNVTKITGANESGKSSVLDAIYSALVGSRGGPSAPVRRGAGRGQVIVDLDEFTVTRMWNEGGDPKGEMWIEAKDGRRYGTPQAMLDELMGKISFDPLAFMRMTPKQQMEELRKLLDIDDILFELQAKEKVDYNQRTEATKMLKALEAQRLAIQFPADLPKKKRDLDAMMQELTQVADYNMGIERERLQRQRDVEDHQMITARAELRMKRLEELQKETDQLIADNRTDLDEADALTKKIKAYKPLPKPKDAQEISDEIATARAVNAAIDRRTEAEAKDAEIKRVAGEIEKLATSLDAHRRKQAEVIAKAKYPVPGLGFSEDEVIYNDLPFTQASNARQIEVSVAMGMANNAKLRLMRIKDGSLLDADSMAVIDGMAEKHNFHVLVEVVDTTGKVGVYLVDGEIAAIDGEKPPVAPVTKLSPPRKKATRKSQEIPAED
jgi:P-loop containing region of AAA domain